MSQSVFGYLKSLKLQATRGTPGATDMGLVVRVLGVISSTITGTVTVQGTAIPTATKSNVVAAAADTLLLAANAARRGALFYNDSDKILYISFGAVAASATSYTTQVPVGGTMILDDRHGYEVRGIWAAGPTGSARVTELT